MENMPDSGVGYDPGSIAEPPQATTTRQRQRAGSDSQEGAQCAPPGLPFKHTFIHSGSSLGQGSLLSSDTANLLGLAAPASVRICSISACPLHCAT